MDKLFTMVTILLSLASYGQSVSKSDSLQILNAIKVVFQVFENSDFDKFQKISANNIYCILCFKTTDFGEQPYMIERKEFFKDYLTDLKKQESYIRALKSNEIKLVKEGGYRSDITAYLTTWKRNEYAEGHEGESLGLYFKKDKEEFKFAGIETIP